MLRGEIYLATVENNSIGSVQNIFQRPMIIVSNHMSLLYSSVIHAVPLTSKSKRWMPTHVSVSAYSSGLVKDSIAMCEQAMLVPISAFSKKIGMCDSATILKMDYAIAVQFGLVEVKRNNIAYA